jgi:immune inhibitor A
MSCHHEPPAGSPSSDHYWEHLCTVAPSPELEARIRTELAEATRNLSFAGAIPLRPRLPVQWGLNDGVIIPEHYFPLGTPAAVVRSAAAERAPLRGTVRIVIVLVRFSDTNFTAAHDANHFRNLFFSEGVLPNGSVREYFNEAAHGLIQLTGEVVGPFTLSNTMAHYAHGESGTGGSAPNARDMAREAAILANPHVNYAPFDNDGNGFVDAFIVLHAGPGAEETGNANHIWSHKWVLAGGELAVDGTKIFGYLTVPEDAKIGVCAHELGHLIFGWPDLYDTDGSSEGIGNWCLMAGGSWNGSGDIPSHPSAWCKANQGWVSVTAQTTNADLTIPDVKASHNVLRLWKDGSSGSEYFLVENRQKTGYDRKNPGEGLLIWHIDDSVAANSNESRPKVALMQADGQRHLENASNRGDAGDAYPGSSNNRSFSASTNPSSRSYGGVDTCVSLTNISNTGATMTARATVRCFVKSVAADKRLIRDKSTRLEKRIQFEKRFEWPSPGRTAGPSIAGGMGVTGPGAAGGGGAEEPFIGAELRPDLAAGAMAEEPDQSNIRAAMEAGDASAKRLFDAKLCES